MWGPCGRRYVTEDFASRSLSEKTADKIFNLIVHEKRYLPGERISSENELAAELNVSRTTIREAVRVLVTQGVLEIRRGIGTFVTQNVQSIPSLDFPSFDAMRIKAKDLFELRLIFEPAVAKYACIRATDEERDEIIRLGNSVIEQIKAGGDWPQTDRQFHQAIIQAAHNGFIAQFLPYVEQAFMNGIAVADLATLSGVPVRDNPDICRAFKQRDADLAQIAMSLHLQHVLQAML